MSKKVEQVLYPGEEFYAAARAVGEEMRESLENDKNFYVFSPDETTSNKIDAVYEASERAWQGVRKEWDLPSSAEGRIVELLSENTLFACMLGHIMTGGTGVMVSYEAFLTIIISQILQQIKFIVQAEGVPWRAKMSGVNLISTSTCWRQDHNGFSHQSPGLISTLLDVPSGKVNCLFPVDDVASREAYNYMMKTKDVVNLMTVNKTEEPRWIDTNHAKFQLENGGASIFGFASDGNWDENYVFTAAGDIVTREALYAMEILRADLPGVKMRFVGIGALTYGAIGTVEQKLTPAEFEEYFGQRGMIIGNFHGYSGALKGILGNYTDTKRVKMHGFSEFGGTTTPFEMLALNHASRYDLCLEVAKNEARSDLVEKYEAILAKNRRFAGENGVDLPEVREFRY